MGGLLNIRNSKSQPISSILRGAVLAFGRGLRVRFRRGGLRAAGASAPGASAPGASAAWTSAAGTSAWGLRLGSFFLGVIHVKSLTYSWGSPPTLRGSFSAASTPILQMNTR